MIYIFECILRLPLFILHGFSFSQTKEFQIHIMSNSLPHNPTFNDPNGQAF